MAVERGDGDDDDEGRQREGDGDGERAGDAAQDVAAVDAELVGERAGAGGGERQAILVLLLGEPAARLDEVAADVVSESHGAAEAEGAEAEEVGDEGEHGVGC